MWGEHWVWYCHVNNDEVQAATESTSTSHQLPPRPPHLQFRPPPFSSIHPDTLCISSIMAEMPIGMANTPLTPTTAPKLTIPQCSTEEPVSSRSAMQLRYVAHGQVNQW